MRKMFAVAVGAMVTMAGNGAVGAAAPSQSVTLTQILPRQTIYDWSANPCAEKYIPDGPARAFRRADGKLVLMAEELDNWEMVGNNPFNLKVSCPSILSSKTYGATVRGMVGIQATYTEDGQTIYGFAGQDMSPVNYSRGCVDQGDGNCWLNDITGVISHDMGQTFSFTSNTNGDVAALSHTLSNTMPNLLGYFTSSNILKKDGYYYMMVPANRYQTDERECLARTNNLADPTSWRAYDGSGYTVVMQPPANGSNQIPCTAVGVNSIYQMVTSFNYIPSKNLYIAVYQGALRFAGDVAAVPAAYYATSTDMINWGAPKRIIPMQWDARVVGTTEVTAYPVLIDPFSRSRNFETIDSNTPVLVFTATKLYNQGVTMDRDLVAIPFMMQ